MRTFRKHLMLSTS